MDWAQYWWSKVTGPHAIVESVIDRLLAKTNVHVVDPHRMPWPMEFRHTLRNSLTRNPDLGTLGLNVIDLSGATSDEGSGDPGTYLLQAYGRLEDQHGYRPRKGETLQQYLQTREILHNKIVWVHGDGKAMRPWADFCREWKIRNYSDGLFILESDMPAGRSRGWLHVIAYDDYVGEFDERLFNSDIMGSPHFGGLNDGWKRYAATIATHLCAGNPETSLKFLERHDFLRGEPLKTFGAVSGSGCDEEASLRLWTGQLEVLYPIIERERIEIVDRYRDRLDELVAEGIEQFKGQVKESDDIEYGTLSYLIATHRLVVDDATTRQRIGELRTCRNLLAHRTPLDLDHVRLLLG